MQKSLACSQSLPVDLAYRVDIESADRPVTRIGKRSIENKKGQKKKSR
jgi:hypothetical protein